MPLSKEAYIQMAISAWKEKKVKSKLKAAEIFGIPESILCDWLTEETLIQLLLDIDR
ncbi:hypothetical protein ASPWEDRAFT_427181 [Aspergillus wentii DTO 134E9]|uniref:Uncharacterized protein n=1 Tax=Aspergillus wentii DTO 134E9 TaxID=1073089 RepID=A0A1L9RPC0_ASPWE|nr:uncharacterized protein ASPWEDRAFT_427181 [Aspergillus wentii DTO 134E9]OJJ36786.1 hypothetical protein ASPWEDRAFT_427181 [Aspergillus wentii DTO 134E9]